MACNKYGADLTRQFEYFHKVHVARSLIRMTHQTAAEIQARFLDEQSNIRRFIITADEYTQINDEAVNHLSYLLKMNGVIQFFQRPVQRKSQPFDAAEVAALLAIIDQLEPKLRDLSQDQGRQIERFEADISANSIPADTFGLIGDWIQYIDANLSQFPTDEEKETLVEQAMPLEWMLARIDRLAAAVRIHHGNRLVGS
jgi:hypothetical protein